MIPAGPFILEEDAFGGKVGATDGTGLSAVVDSSIKINFSESYGYVYCFNHLNNFMYRYLGGGRVRLNTANRTICNTGL